MKYTVELVERYSSEIVTAFKDMFAVMGMPKAFFSSKGFYANTRTIMSFVVVLSILLVVLEIPIMKKVGISPLNLIFHSVQVVFTIVLFLVYALSFQLFATIFRTKSSFFGTYKIVAYSSSWFLVMYLFVYGLQATKYEAMAKTGDAINMGYYQEFRSVLDNSTQLSIMNAFGFLFVLLFLIWAYKGFRFLHKVSRIKAISCAICGTVLMQTLLHFVQDPINNYIIIAFL